MHLRFTTSMIWLSHLHMLEEYPEILTIGEVAEILRVTRLTLKRWEQKGLIQPIRINSRGDRRYTKKQILALLGQ
ncbi:hypothetical protein COX05_00085 [candidate division WWE3 bacterium CG22_combo_CG10-13_8_21_14_all_39_12]|uniref:HTH merR-type domain-containing protein n=2 Tax=Katanobacteria TaxID=422282 RepID=A0A2M7X417_UNCKA|nr:MAG: hypothetical protein COX05_00085 [candidate division WWE3 bacterium CG22_combo_CG10-13_8_21_14_all_39_12]PJA40880.1 MAG: hypothetical protein CO179_01110 [candidate division WWE3 bacterium CG_4_9_14_3_um_filter_39_7]